MFTRSGTLWRRILLPLIGSWLIIMTLGGAARVSAAASAISLNQVSYAQGATIVASYSTAQVSSTNWIGIYASNDQPGAVASRAWAYAPNSSGSVNLSTSSLVPGSYTAYYLSNNGYTSLASPIFFTIVSGATTTTPHSMACVGQDAYAPGQTVVISYATTQVSSTNWVGLYPSGSQPGSTPSLVWAYAPHAYGSVSLSTSSLSPGSYAAYYLYNDGYTPLTSPASFSVTSSGTAGSPNLLVNGNAECADASVSGYDSVTIPGWQIAGVPSVVSYAAGNGFPAQGTAGPANRGNQFFSGGPVGDSSLTQTADVSAAAAQIDGGSVTYNLSGWLGGYASETSSATLSITFQSADGASLGTAQIGPVTAADRNTTTALLSRTSTGSVPSGTRSIAITLRMQGDATRDANNKYNDAYADDLSLTLSTPLAAPAVPAPALSLVPTFDHVFFVMLENKTYEQVIGNASAPYLTGLANENVTLGQSYGVVHPSDPNYMAVAGGSTFGHTDNPMPNGIGTLAAPHIGDLVENAGKTWRGYIEDMKSPCNLTANGYYDPDNLPFLFFQDIASNPARCQNDLQPITRLWTDLQSAATTPNFVWFEPNTCNTMHSCSVDTGDTWMRNNLPTIFASPAWTQQRSLLIITFDEDDDIHGQRVPTIIVGSPGSVKTAFQSNRHYTHYNILCTMEYALGLGNLTQNDQYANPINDIW